MLGQPQDPRYPYLDNVTELLPVRRQRLLDGCDRCLEHTPPSSMIVQEDNETIYAAYLCRPCGYLWQTSWHASVMAA